MNRRAARNAQASLPRRTSRSAADTKFGCLWTLLSIIGLTVGTAVVVAVIWLFTGPNPMIRF